MSLLAIKYKRGHLEILNQLLLPHKSVYEEIRGVEDGWQAIKTMKVRKANKAKVSEDLVTNFNFFNFQCCPYLLELTVFCSKVLYCNLKDFKIDENSCEIISSILFVHVVMQGC